MLLLNDMMTTTKLISGEKAIKIENKNSDEIQHHLMILLNHIMFNENGLFFKMDNVVDAISPALDRRDKHFTTPSL